MLCLCSAILKHQLRALCACRNTGISRLASRALQPSVHEDKRTYRMRILLRGFCFISDVSHVICKPKLRGCEQQSLYVNLWVGGSDTVLHVASLLKTTSGQCNFLFLSFGGYIWYYNSDKLKVYFNSVLPQDFDVKQNISA